MNYIQSVALLVSSEFREVAKSPELLMLMLRLYSKMYLNGGQPSTCEKCHYKYFNQIKKDGAMKAELQEEIDKRTLMPAFKGRKYINKINSHVNDAMLTDAKAIELLKIGALRESDFKELPKCYKKAETKKRKPRAKK